MNVPTSFPVTQRLRASMEEHQTKARKKLNIKEKPSLKSQLYLYCDCDICKEKKAGIVVLDTVFQMCGKNPSLFVQAMRDMRNKGELEAAKEMIRRLVNGVQEEVVDFAAPYLLEELEAIRDKGIMTYSRELAGV